MKHIYQDNLRPFLHAEITGTVKELKLTKEKTAEILAIDTRSYAYFTSGKTMCSASTLVVYLTRLCPDPIRFLDGARKVIDKADSQQ